MPIFGGLRGGKYLDQHQQNPSIIVIIPSRNMPAVIEHCVTALQASYNPQDKFNVYVFADHSTYDIASLAESAGANVLVRDDGPAGRTYALSWMLAKLTEMGMSPDTYTRKTRQRVWGRLIFAVTDCIVYFGQDIVVSHAIVGVKNKK